MPKGKHLSFLRDRNGEGWKDLLALFLDSNNIIEAASCKEFYFFLICTFSIGNSINNFTSLPYVTALCLIGFLQIEGLWQHCIKKVC